MKRAVWTGFFAMALLGPVFGQAGEGEPYWYTLEQGKHYFRSGDYGEALVAFEGARDQRRAMYSRMEQELIDLLSIPEARRLGDSLDLLESYIAERGHIDAAAALEELYYRVPRDSLGNSAQSALTAIGRLKDFPDAENWIGEAYRVEREYGIALRQYERAWEQRALLETPGFDLEILYKIADLHRLRQEYAAMEERLLEILMRDTLWQEDTSSFIRAAMMRTLENEGVSSCHRVSRIRISRSRSSMAAYSCLSR